MPDSWQAAVEAAIAGFYGDATSSPHVRMRAALERARPYIPAARPMRPGQAQGTAAEVIAAIAEAFRQAALFNNAGYLDGDEEEAAAIAFGIAVPLIAAGLRAQVAELEPSEPRTSCHNDAPREGQPVP
jgi:hypothetical protein